LSTHDRHDMAEALLAKARGDEAGLRVLADHEDVPDHVAGFLAQQAVEKAIKAVLTARGTAYDRITGLGVFSSLLFSDQIIEGDQSYGAAGVVLGITSYLIGFGVCLHLGAVFGRVWNDARSADAPGGTC